MNNGNVLLINNLDTLSLDKFSGEILRVENTKDIYADDVNPLFDTSVSPIDTEVLPLSETEKIIESEIINKISEINLERNLSTKSEI